MTANKYEILFEKANDAILFIKGVEIIDCNSKTLEVFGCEDKSEIIGRTILDFSPDFQPDGESSNAKAQKIREKIQKADNQKFYWKHCRKNRSVFVTEVSLNILKDEENETLYAVIRDVTEAENRKKNLIESEERFKIIFENAPDAMYLNDLDGRIIYGNLAAEKLMGASRDKFINKTFFETILDSEDIPKAIEGLKKNAEGLKSGPNEYKINTTEGQKTVEMSGHPVWINGKLVTLGIARDISKRKAIENELIRAKELAEKNEQKLLESQHVAKIGHFSLDIKTGIYTLSPELERIVGLDNSVVYSTDLWLSILHPDDKEVGKNLLQKDALLTIKNRNREYRIIQAKTGKIVWVRSIAEVRYDSNNNPIELFGTIQDITTLKETELKLKDNNQELLRSKEEILLKNRISNAMILSKEEELYKSTLDIILEILKCDFGYFGYIDNDDGEKLICPSFAHQCVNNCKIKHEQLILSSETWTEVWGESLKSKKSLYSNSSMVFPTCEAIINNALAVPVLYKTNLIGQIVVANKEGGFNHQHKQILEDICNYISPLLHSKLMKSRYSKELIKAKEKSEESELKYKRLTENTHDFIYTLDLSSRHTMVNESASKAMGLDISEIIGKNYFDLGFPKELAEEWREMHLEVINTAKEMKFETTTPMPDGYERTYEVTLTPVLGDSKKVTGIRGINRDITDQKRYQNDLLKALEKIEESETKFRGAFENAGIGMCLVSPQGAFLETNKALSKILGYTESELMYMTFQEITYPDDLVMDLKLLNETIEGERDSYSIVKRYISKAGAIIYANLYVSLVRNSNLEPLFFVSQIENITKQKQYEKQLIAAKEKAEESEQKLNEAQKIGRLGSGEWFLNSDKVTWSDELYDMLGFDKTQPPLSFKEQMRLYTPESLEMANEIFRQAVFTNQPYEAELEMIRSDNTIINVLARGRAVSDESGKPYKIQGTVLDITERKNLEKALIQAKEKAVESDRLKTAFLLNMSHEIRTPLNGMLGFIELLNEPDLDEETRQFYINVVNQGGERLMKTINDIIEISRIEAGDVSLSLEKTDMAQLMKYYSDFFRPQAAEKGLEFILNQNIPDELINITTDKHKLDGILSNIIRNAIKYTNSGSVVIESAIDKENLILTISDTGIGIPENKIDIIFDRFVQVDSSLNKNYEGAGIGLSIAKGYVDALQGKIKIESKEKLGSTFTVILPLETKNKTK